MPTVQGNDASCLIMLSCHVLSCSLCTTELFAAFDVDADGSVGLDEFESLIAAVLNNQHSAGEGR
jgi:hypothetical protein